MKKSYQHIIKKSYTTPKIEEVEIDREMSLVMVTDPPIPPDDPTDPGDLEGVGSYDQKELPSYRSATYPEASTPFGGSMPEY
jgi:hypothetical protein